MQGTTRVPLRDPPQGDCFVATASVGTPNAPQVHILRRVRDEKLSQTKIGRRFIAWYYLHGPIIASVIKKSALLRLFARILVIHPMTLIARILLRSEA